MVVAGACLCAVGVDAHEVLPQREDLAAMYHPVRKTQACGAEGGAALAGLAARRMTAQPLGHHQGGTETEKGSMTQSPGAE